MVQKRELISLIGLTLLMVGVIQTSHGVQADAAAGAIGQQALPSCQIADTCESETFGLSVEEVAAYPVPDVTQVQAQQSIVYDRIYRRVTDAVTTYDSPGGSAVGSVDAGFNFVTVMQERDGWSQISAERWVRSDALTDAVPNSTFSGVYLPDDPLPYPIAWVLVNVYPAKYPGGPHTEANPVVTRYTTVNIYSAVYVDGWRWYQIGADQWLKQTQVAKVLPIERPEDVDTERWFSVDLYEQVLVAYEGETPVFATLVSSGLAEWPTNQGLFHVYLRYTRTIMSGAYGQPDFYYLEEVPWTMYFDHDIALHGAYWHDGFGYRRSHGCVNMSVMDAYLMYAWSMPEFDPVDPEDTGPAVFVYSSGDYR